MSWAYLISVAAELIETGNSLVEFIKVITKNENVDVDSMIAESRKKARQKIKRGRAKEWPLHF